MGFINYAHHFDEEPELTRDEAIAIVSAASTVPKHILDIAYKYLEDHPSEEKLYSEFKEQPMTDLQTAVEAQRLYELGMYYATKTNSGQHYKGLKLLLDELNALRQMDDAHELSKYWPWATGLCSAHQIPDPDCNVCRRPQVAPQTVSRKALESAWDRGVALDSDATWPGYKRTLIINQIHALQLPAPQTTVEALERIASVAGNDEATKGYRLNLIARHAEEVAASLRQVGKGDDSKRLYDIGWEWLNNHADGEVCLDRSCIRCRLADVLFDIEKMYPHVAQQSQPTQVAPKGQRKDQMNVVLNRLWFKVDKASSTGAEIRAFPEFAHDMRGRESTDVDLYVMGMAGTHDRKIEDDDVVEWSEGLRLFTVPRFINNSAHPQPPQPAPQTPAMFGATQPKQDVILPNLYHQLADGTFQLIEDSWKPQPTQPAPQTVSITEDFLAGKIREVQKSIAPELLDALRREHLKSVGIGQWTVHTIQEPDCPVCQLIRRAEE